MLRAPALIQCNNKWSSTNKSITGSILRKQQKHNFWQDVLLFVSSISFIDSVKEPKLHQCTMDVRATFGCDSTFPLHEIFYLSYKTSTIPCVFQRKRHLYSYIHCKLEIISPSCVTFAIFYVCERKHQIFFVSDDHALLNENTVKN